LGAFGDALVKAAKTTPASTADPHVSAAFALGWQMAELYRPQQRRRTERAADDLPGLGSLGDADRIQILVDQIQAAIFRLNDPVKKAGLADIDTAPLRASLREGREAQSKAVAALHRTLLGSLTAADFRLGKAYGLGRALADTCRKPTDSATLREELGKYRLANLLGWLDDLSSALPPHAAHSVASSIERWRDWAARPGDAEGASAPRALRRQGELWRALLSGEKDGTEMLEIKNYLDAGRTLTRQMRALLWSVIARFPLLVALAVTLLSGGIVLLVAGGGAETVGGAGSLLAALGLTWKGLGGTLGQLVGKVEQPLWGAALDAAITDAIDLLPDSEHDQRGRRELAQQMAAPPHA
jgi:hypothetical protein